MSFSYNPAEHPSDCFACGKEAIDGVIARRRSAEEQKAVAEPPHYNAFSV
jgi:hypothetical protein